jgi:hypothetical protein
MEGVAELAAAEGALEWVWVVIVDARVERLVVYDIDVRVVESW